MALVDSFGRTIEYLRMSVTDKCGLRCVYCMPAAGVEPMAHDEVLRNEEFARIARIAVGLGISKIRLTGGEPLVRRGIVDLTARIAALPGLRDLAMTTNAQALAGLACELKRAGLRRVNVSLDSMRPHVYRTMTRGGELALALEGIEAAENAGLTPIRINVVVIGGINDSEVEDLARITQTRPWDVRFIEVMPFSGGRDCPEARHVSIEEIRERVARLAGRHVDVAGTPPMGPADYVRLPGALGRVGFIGYSGHEEGFCGLCNRIRLTCDGALRPCLVSSRTVDLRTPLRAGATDQEIAALIRTAVSEKPPGRVIGGTGHRAVDDSMNQVGG